MVALSAEEAGALRARLAGSKAAHSAAGTLSVSVNASTSVTFTEGEKAAVLDVLVDWLGPSSESGETGLAALQDALARDLGTS
jgi:hypothetical protein